MFENVDFFLTRAIILKVYNDLLENVCPRTFKTFFVFWNCRIGELDKENLSFIGCKKRKRPLKHGILFRVK